MLTIFCLRKMEKKNEFNIFTKELAVIGIKISVLTALHNRFRILNVN